MKSLPVFRRLTLSALLALAPVGLAFAQTADPTASVAPSKPAAETATPAPSVTASPSPTPTTTTADAEAPKKRTPEEKQARKADRLRKYDTNHDGKLDKKEKAAMRADMGLAPAKEEVKASPTP